MDEIFGSITGDRAVGSIRSLRASVEVASSSFSSDASFTVPGRLDTRCWASAAGTGPGRGGALLGSSGYKGGTGLRFTRLARFAVRAAFAASLSSAVPIPETDDIMLSAGVEREAYDCWPTEGPLGRPLDNISYAASRWALRSSVLVLARGVPGWLEAAHGPRTITELCCEFAYG